MYKLKQNFLYVGGLNFNVSFCCLNQDTMLQLLSNPIAFKMV